MTRRYEYWLITPSEKKIPTDLDQIFERMETHSEEQGIYWLIDSGDGTKICWIVRYAKGTPWGVSISLDATKEEKEKITKTAESNSHHLLKWHDPNATKERGFGLGYENLTPPKYEDLSPPEADHPVTKQQKSDVL